MLVPISRGLSVIIDEADAEIATQHRWTASASKRSAGKSYAHRSASKKELSQGYPSTIYLHRVLLGAKKGEQVDHINGDALDCRRQNLRLCNQSQNNANSEQKRGRTGFRGVYTANGKWRASITREGKTFRTRFVATAEEAARMYDSMARAAFGDFATLNFPGLVDVPVLLPVPITKLTMELASRIRSDTRSNYSLIAADYGISRQRVSAIKRNEAWKSPSPAAAAGAGVHGDLFAPGVR